MLTELKKKAFITNLCYTYICIWYFLFWTKYIYQSGVVSFKWKALFFDIPYNKTGWSITISYFRMNGQLTMISIKSSAQRVCQKVECKILIKPYFKFWIGTKTDIIMPGSDSQCLDINHRLFIYKVILLWLIFNLQGHTNYS